VTAVLWHIVVSHYSEKVRWALDVKRVPHVRRRPPPPAHIPCALWLSRGRSFTFPVLELDGRAIADSTAIIAALEQRLPDPRLYPADPAERERALALEDFFDEQVAPYVRRFAFYELRRDPERFAAAGVQAAPELFGRSPALASAIGRGFTGLRYGARDAARADQARARVLAGLDRLESELGDREYLVGGGFTVADLTAAAILYPMVLPPEGPLTLDGLPEPLERLRESVEDRRGYAWVQEMYARHRAKP
jgi:glutathione S-transferase